MKEKSVTVTLEVPSTSLPKMASFYADVLCPVPNEYVAFLAKNENASITAYKKEKNGLVKVVFQGPEAEYECSIWGQGRKAETKITPPRREKRVIPPPFVSQIGSDEVGTGDFFGPILVVAAYCDEEGLSKLELLGVTDSKKMTDDYILEIGPKLLAYFDYSLLCLDNTKYNEVNEAGLNMNAIKARLHNQALYNLSLRHPEATICQDQFAEPKLYYSYLRQEAHVVKNIHFSTKGELAYKSVALASCIARYAFLKKMEEMGKAYGTKIPLGAGSEVDSFAERFVKKFGKAELQKVAKLNFKNYQKL